MPRFLGIDINNPHEAQRFGLGTARLGYVSSNWLLYGKAGRRLGRNHFEWLFYACGWDAGRYVQQVCKSRGWAAGAGVEWALHPIGPRGSSMTTLLSILGPFKATTFSTAGRADQQLHKLWRERRHREGRVELPLQLGRRPSSSQILTGSSFPPKTRAPALTGASGCLHP